MSYVRKMLNDRQNLCIVKGKPPFESRHEFLKELGPEKFHFTSPNILIILNIHLSIPIYSDIFNMSWFISLKRPR